MAIGKHQGKNKGLWPRLGGDKGRHGNDHTNRAGGWSANREVGWSKKYFLVRDVHFSIPPQEWFLFPQEKKGKTNLIYDCIYMESRKMVLMD